MTLMLGIIIGQIAVDLIHDREFKVACLSWPNMIPTGVILMIIVVK